MRARATRFAVGALWILIFGGCGGESGTGPPEEKISAAAESYLNAALDIMQAHSINRYKIDWPPFRARAFEEAGAAQVPADTYDAIRFALQQLGDHHSHFRPPGGQLQEAVVPQAPAKAPSAQHLGEGIGYVSVSAFSGSGDAANQLATDYHRMIEGVDTLGVCGWVVDLRGNTGGNMWPMVAGIGPIVGEGVLGFFVDPDSVVKTWTYESGSSRLDAYIAAQATDPYELALPDPPVAVITDSLTGSSGEATTIAFRGRPDARSFGRPTWGVSTANGTFLLSDGAALILTVSTMADRTGQLYGEKVIPDQLVDGPRTGDPETDQPLAASMDWLREQPACSGWSPFLSTIFENPGRSP
jgi:hypothetical protein